MAGKRQESLKAHTFSTKQKLRSLTVDVKITNEHVAATMVMPILNWNIRACAQYPHHDNVGLEALSQVMATQRRDVTVRIS
jgi:hypothetical protein